MSVLNGASRSRLLSFMVFGFMLLSATVANAFTAPTYGGVYSGSYSLAKPSGGCYQAHCEDTLAGRQLAAPPLPSGGTLSELWAGGNDGTTSSGPGLGCSANLTIFACSFQGSGPNVVIYNADGSHPSGGTTSDFDSNASSSAPIVFADGGVIGADDLSIGYDPAGSSTWYYAALTDYSNPTATIQGNRTQGVPISPVMVGTDIVFAAESCHPSNTVCGAATFTFGVNTSARFVTQTAYHSMIFSGVQYETFNTPTVDNTRSPARVYVSASVQCAHTCGLDSARQGAIIAFDIQTASGSGHGQIVGTPTIIFSFPGPSGSSPALITSFTSSTGATGNGLFFDGLPHSSSAAPTTQSACTPSSGFTYGAYFSGCFYGILDPLTSTAGVPNPATILWANIYPSDQFQAGAVLDPRSEVWIFPINVTNNINATCTTLGGPTTPPFDNCLLSLNPQTGALNGRAIDLTSVIVPLDTTVSVTDASQAPIAADLYTPSTPPVISTAVSGGVTHYYLTAGVNDRGRTNPRVVLTDVTAFTPGASSSVSPSGIWVTPMGGDFGGSGTYGQFGILSYTDGTGSHVRTVFGGFTFGPYVFGY